MSVSRVRITPLPPYVLEILNLFRNFTYLRTNRRTTKRAASFCQRLRSGKYDAETLSRRVGPVNPATQPRCQPSAGVQRFTSSTPLLTRVTDRIDGRLSHDHV